MALGDSKVISNVGDIKFSVWNIRDFNSKILGKKLVSEDFLKEIRDYDIIGLTETHIHDEILEHLSIHGFEK